MGKIIIAAVAKNNVIGRSSGEMPWDSKEETQHFKQSTQGFPVIMGRKTFEVLGKPLEGRTNIIITKDSMIKEKFEDILIYDALKDAYKFCESNNYEKVFIIGGGQIFEKAIADADEMIISHMNLFAEGDVFFPKIDFAQWNIASRRKRNGFEIVNYKRSK
jgi:dihydrofolate reductase